MELGREENAMSMTAAKTVRELALENTTATRVFEKLGIDYCCEETNRWTKPAGRPTSR
jgi:iron-sulfur cluster repair protein YtfE (RIC family)